MESDDYKKGYEAGVKAERERCIKIALEIEHEGEWVALSIDDPNYIPSEPKRTPYLLICQQERQHGNV